MSLKEVVHMNCLKCGAELPDDSKFCAVCGTPVSAAPVNPAADQPFVTAQPASESSQTAPEAKSEKKKSIKKLLLTAVLALLAVAVLGTAVFFAYKALSSLTGQHSGFEKQSTLLLVSGQDEVQILGDNASPIKIDGEIGTYSYSMDGKSLALTVDADDEGLSSLKYCDGTKSYDVADDVYTFFISPACSRIAYLTDFDFDTYTGTLFIYDTASKKSEEITDDAASGGSFSPDGKSYSYISDIETDDYGTMTEFTGYVSIDGGKPEKLDTNMCAAAISDGGRYIYYVEADPDTQEDTLYVRSGKTDTKLGSLDSYSAVYLNRDCTEVLFGKGGSTYISVKGADKEKVSGMDMATMVSPDSIQYSYSYVSNTYALTLGVKSFAGQLYAFTEDDSGTTLSYVGKDYETTDIDELDDSYYMYDMFLSRDGKALYYLNDSGKILYYKNYRDFDTDPEKFDAGSDVYGFTVMPDQSAVYFVDDEETLWVKRGNADPEEVADSVDYGTIYAAPDGKGLYFLSDVETDEESYTDIGTLHYVADKKDAEPEEIAEDVSNIEVSDYGIVYYVYDHVDEDTYNNIGEAFFSKDGKTFESIMDDAVIY